MKDTRGFTIIELVLVLVLIAILSATVAPMLLRGTATIGTGAFARKVKDDVRYAQALAMSRSNLPTPNVTNPGFRYRIRFNVPDPNCPFTNQYTIVNDADNNGVWGEKPDSLGIIESARNPATGATYFCVQTDSGDLVGFTATADFGGTTPGILEFDGFGVPYNSDGAKLTASRTVLVSRGAETVTLTVNPYTGWVNMQ